MALAEPPGARRWRAGAGLLAAAVLAQLDRLGVSVPDSQMPGGPVHKPGQPSKHEHSDNSEHDDKR